jgi:lipopolysaccharide transport system permease protein
MHRVIKRRTGLARLDLDELWRYRELVGFLAWRDVVLRYKQTAIGVLWAFIRPFVTMVIFTVIFGRVAKLPSDGVPYPILTFAALLPWMFFSTAFVDAANTVVGNGHMITKIYFPRLVLPLASLAVGAIDFFVSLFFLVVIMGIYRFVPSAHIIYLPFFILLCAALTIGLGLWFAAWYVKYRDIRHLIPFLVQIGLYASPVAYSTSRIPEQWRFLYSLNPMVGIIDGFRWSILGRTPLYMPGLIAGTVITVAVLFGGVYYFKQTEPRFADFI